MSNPYTKPSISGYNANPPADDGSQVPSNEVTWAKHKDKIGDPLKNYVDAINQEARDAFGLTFLSGISAQSTAYTVQTSDRGKLISVTNTTTITLLPAATAGSGFPLAIRNAGSGTVTVDGDGAETINGSATKSLLPGQTLVLTCDGTAWEGYVAFDDDSTSVTINSFDFTYDEQRLTLDGDWSGNSEEVVITRVGNAVTIMGVGTLTHSSTAQANTSVGFVPSALRPSNTVNFLVSQDGNVITRVFIESDGQLNVQYFDYAGSLTAQTSSPSFSVTYILDGNIA